MELGPGSRLGERRRWQELMNSVRLSTVQGMAPERRPSSLKAQPEAQLEELKASVPKTFECGICFEEEPEFMVTQIDLCNHKFCRCAYI